MHRTGVLLLFRRHRRGRLPLELWDDKGSMAQFCDRCARRWFGVMRFREHSTLIHQAGKCIGDGTPIALPYCETTDTSGSSRLSTQDRRHHLPHRPDPRSDPQCRENPMPFVLATATDTR